MISIISPVYNEKESLKELYQRVAEVFKDKKFELIFVNDGSTDGSGEVIEEIAKKDTKVRLVSFKRNQGKSKALMAGFEAAKGEEIITMDADLQDRPEETPKLISELSRYDLVSGWKKKRNDPFLSVVFSRVFNFVVGITTGVYLHDINCGLKAYRREVTENINLYGDLYRFIPVLASREGFKVGEIEVQHEQRKYGSSKYGYSKFLRGFFDLFTILFLTNFKLRPLHLFGLIGGVMILMGLIACSYLTIVWFSGEAIGGRPLLFLGVLLIISGLQFFLSGLLAELIIYYKEN
ncbi:glycosyltransferase [Candidatus Microgenomates bacterium]|jgi:glycosyltransferase involved in cell wall biosynthesis|nr:MAG: glycosyltransferase [Candidatus Microgenomates bacterium]